MSIDLKLIFLENVLLIFILVLIFQIYLKKFYHKKLISEIAIKSQRDLHWEERIKQKLSELDTENDTLRKEINRLKVITEELNSDLSDYKNKLKTLMEVLDSKEQENEQLRKTLETIEKLFSAKRTENLKHYQLISEVEKFLFREFIPQIDALNILENEYEIFERLREEFEQWKLTEIREWDKGKVNIAFIGKFSSGKSSIINSLLGSDLLPVDITPTTAVPSFISHGFIDTVYYEDSERVIREIDKETFSNISYITLKNIPISFFIRYFVVFSDLSAIQHVNILDTPGFSSENELDRKRMLDSISLVDAIFYVIDINDGTLTQDALSVLSEIKSREDLKEKPVYIIINKCDLKRIEKEREEIRKHIIKVLENHNIQYKEVLLYSSKKNINNCQEFLIETIKNLREIKNEHNIFDSMILLCTECISRLKREYSRINSKTHRTTIIENQIDNLNKLLERTKKYKRGLSDDIERI